jgi:hypothetical protein
MAANLHVAVCETYRQAIAERRAEREAFDMAARVVCERHPGVRPVEARRRVAEMLCGDPPVAGVRDSGGEFVQISCHGVSRVTDKSSDKFSPRPAVPALQIGTASISDGCETASVDSFPASDAPSWTVVVGAGAPRRRGGLLPEEEPSS